MRRWEQITSCLGSRAVYLAFFPQVKVTTVDGPVELKIPAGTQPGTTLLMAKRGVPRLGNVVQRGDHQVHVRVKIPKSLTNEERKLVEELRELQKKVTVGPFKF